MTKFKIVFGVVIAVIAGVAIYGAYLYPNIPVSFGASTQGTTGQTAKQYNVYGVNLAAPGANATSSSILNNTGNDLYPTQVIVGCEGVATSKTAYTGAGLATLTFSVGTTSTAAPAAAPSNLLVNAYVIGTSTANFVMASTTSVTGNTAATGVGIWPAGSYMTFQTNATNTAVCTFGLVVTSS